jgi:hypothetical protein
VDLIDEKCHKRKLKKHRRVRGVHKEVDGAGE